MNDERDERLERMLAELREGYNAPPETPREAIWARIREERDAAARRRPLILSPRVWLPLAAAAALFFGFMLGRDSLREDAARHVAQVTEQMEKEHRQQLFALAAGPVFSSTEALLTQYRSASNSPETEADLSRWAGQLLVETRLLIDSPAAEDAEFKTLLQDLELTLVRLRRATGGGSEADRRLLSEGLEDSQLIPRLRAKIPAGDPRRGV